MGCVPSVARLPTGNSAAVAPAPSLPGAHGIASATQLDEATARSRPERPEEFGASSRSPRGRGSPLGRTTGSSYSSTLSHVRDDDVLRCPKAVCSIVELGAGLGWHFQAEEQERLLALRRLVNALPLNKIPCEARSARQAAMQGLHARTIYPPQTYTFRPS
jgi:hypothetical protein